MMKRVMTMTLAWGLIAILTGPVQAIDVKKKSTTPAAPSPSSVSPDSTRVKSTASVKRQSSKSLLEKLQREVRASSSKSTDSNKYDNYIDANNDGVDDRVKRKVKESDRVKPASAVSPRADSAKATAKKKKPR